MAETGAVGGVFTPTVTNLKQQSQIEGVDRNLGKQNANQNTDATRSPNTGNRAVASTPARTEGVRAGTENNLQQQAKNLNSANAVSSTNTAQAVRGQNVNELA